MRTGEWARRRVRELALLTVTGIALMLFSGLAAAAPPPWSFSDPAEYSYPAALEVTGGVAQFALNPASPPWWDRNYAYRQEITISHNWSSTMTQGATVRLRLNHAALVSALKAKANGDDVRLVYRNTATNTWTELDRVVEAGTNGWNAVGGALTEIWFKTQNDIGVGLSDSNYYVYYGNAAATNPPASRASVYKQATVNWPGSTGWDGTITGAVLVQSGRVMLDATVGTPVAVSASTPAYEYKVAGGGYASGDVAPPPFSDANWAAANGTLVANGATANSQVWETRVTNARNQWDWIKVKLHLTDSVRTLKATWTGWGDPSLSYNVYLYLLDKNSSTWDQATGKNGFFADSSHAGTLTITITDPVAAAKYVNNGDVWVAVGARHSNYGPVAPTLVSPNAGDTVWDTTQVNVSWNTVATRDQDGDLPTNYTLMWRSAYYSPTTWYTGVATSATTGYFNPGYYGAFYWKVVSTDQAPNAASSSSEERVVYTDYWTPPYSCPFVFEWDGKAWQYSTDLGGKPIGISNRGVNLSLYNTHVSPLPNLVPWSSDEYRVKIRETLASEADFFDEAKLYLVDVPEGYEIRSSTAEEASKVGRKDPLKFYTVKDPHVLVKAIDQEGRDVTSLFKEADGKVNPISMESVILDFGPIAHPENAKLLLDGWKWLDRPSLQGGKKAERKSSEMFVEVIGKDGQWAPFKKIGPPNGNPDWLAIDLSNAWPTSDHRIRLTPFFANWIYTVLDRVALDDSAPVEPKVTVTPLTRAMLSQPGSLTYEMPNAEHPYLVRDDISKVQRVMPPAGSYTKLGDVTPLLATQDDMFVVMHAGDALELSFANAAAPQAGWKRIPVFSGDVWYFSRAPKLGPLPFAGMKTYPYAAPEKYPDDEAHRRYAAEWNTRVVEVDPNNAPKPIPSNGAAPRESLPTVIPAETSQHSLNTDYLAVAAMVYPTTGSNTYTTKSVNLTGTDQFVAAQATYTPASEPANTTLTLKVSPSAGSTGSYKDAPSGTVVPFTASAANNQLQFQATLATSDSAATPSLDTLAVTYWTRTAYAQEPTVGLNSNTETRFTAGSAAITPVSGVQYTSATSFNATPGAGTPTFQVSTDNGSTWKYWNGTSWAAATLPSQTNTATEIDTHLATLPVDLTEGVGYSTFKWRAYLVTDGVQQASLDSVDLVSSLADTLSVAATSSGLTPTVLQAGTNPTPMAKLTLQTDHGAVTWTNFAPSASVAVALNNLQAGGVRVWKDTNSNGNFDPGIDTQVGTGTFDVATRQAAITLSPAQWITSAPAVYFVTYDVLSTASVGGTLDIAFAASSFTVKATGVDSGDTVSAVTLPDGALAVKTIADNPDTVTVGFDGALGVTSPVTEGTSDIQMATLTLATNMDKASLTDLTVNLTGTADDFDLANVKLYLARTLSGRFSRQQDLEVASGTFNGKTVTLHLTTPENLSTSVRRYYLVANLAPNSGAMDFGFSIPNGGVVLATPDVVDAATVFPLASNSLGVVATSQRVTATVTGVLAPGTSQDQGATDIPFLRLDLQTSSGTAAWGSLRVNPTPFPYFSGVKVWRDSRANPASFDPTQTVPVGTPIGAGSAQPLTFDLPQTLTTTNTVYWVTGDLAATGNAGGMARLGIDSALAFGFPGGTAVDGTFPVVSQAVTVIDVPDAVTQSYTTVSADGEQGAANVVLAALQLTTPDTAPLTSLTFALPDTGAATAGEADVTAMHLYKDENDNHQYDAGTDQLVSTGVLDWTGRTVKFSLSGVTVNSTGPNYLLTADLALGATIGHVLTLEATSGTLEFGALSVDTPDATGLPFTTALTVAKRPVTVGLSALTLPSTSVAQGAANAPVAKFSAAADANTATLSGVTVTVGGTGDRSLVRSVKLWRAADDGSFSSEPARLLATAAGPFGATVALTAGTPVGLSTTATTFYVTLDLEETAVIGDTYTVTVAAGTDVSLAAQETAGGTFPLAWTPLTVSRASKQVTITGVAIQPAKSAPGLTNLPMLAFQPTLVADDTILQSVMVDLTGTGPASEVIRVKLWRDNPGTADGAFSPDDDGPALDSAVPVGGRVTLRPDPQTIASTDATWFYVTYDLSDTAQAGGTHGAQLSAAASLTFTRDDQAAGAFPVASGFSTVQSLADGLPAVPNATYVIGAEVDSDPASPGVQTTLYGPATGPVTLRVQYGGIWTGYVPLVAGGTWTLDGVTWRPGANLVEVTDNGVTTTFEVDLIDPEGVVYNAATGAPIAGATVTVRRQVDRSIYDAPQVTGADGRYAFLVPSGGYYMEITAPGFTSVPSGSRLVRVPEGTGLGATPGSRDGIYTEIYYGSNFNVVATPLHFDIPLDPVGFQALSLLKTVDRTTASVGDVVTYRLKLNNPGGALVNVSVSDALPVGLRYLAGTTSIGGVVAADPAVSGHNLTFTIANVAAGGEVWLSYKVVVDPTASPGVLTNTAVVRRPNSAAALSNTATASLKVVRDAFFQLSTVLGRVFVDENGNGRPDPGERGLAGVRVVADDGAVITADAEGRFHLAGLSGPSKGFKLDATSLPAGAALTTPNPVLVALRPGLPSEVEFGVKLAERSKAAPEATAAAPSETDFQLIAGDLRFLSGQVEGRLGAYVKETIAGKYQYVLSYDSGRGKGSQEAAPAEQGYLGYGDQSRISAEAPKSSTPLYLSVTGPGFEAKWGDLQVPAGSGVGSGREATGASLKLKAGEETRQGAARQLTAYAATLSYPKVRDELRAQDGSLYYLSHRPVVTSTLHAWLEARDAFTGQVSTRVELAAGRDFDLDPVAGRIVTKELIPSSVRNGSLLGQPAESDRPVYLVADYQYDSIVAFGPAMYGGRGEAQLGQAARAGVTMSLSEDGQSAVYSADLAGSAGPLAKYRLELGWGRVTEVARYASGDGGVNYQAREAIPAGFPSDAGTKASLEALVDLGKLAEPLEKSAQAGVLAKAKATLTSKNTDAASRPAEVVGGEDASKLQAKVASDLKNYFKPEDFAVGLGAGQPSGSEVSLLKTSPLSKNLLRNQEKAILPDWWKQEGALTLEAKVKDTTAGFSSGADPVTTDEQQLNYKLQAQPAEGVTVKVASEATYTPESNNEKVTGSVHVETAQGGFTAELGEARSNSGSQPAALDRTLAAEYQYKVNETFSVSVGRKIDYEQPDLTVNTLGAAAKTGKVTADAKYSYGEKEKSGAASLGYQLQPGARLYTSWEGGDRDGTDLHRFTVGGSTDVNDRTRLFLERKLDTGADGFSSTDAAGAEFRPQDGLGLSVALGRGLAPNGTERTSGSLGLNLRSKDGKVATTGLEVSNQADGRRDVALRGRGELPVSTDLSLLGRVALSELSGAGYTGGNLTEFAVGAAYRPVDASRPNLLAQVAYRSENGDPSGTGGDASAVESLVVGAEGTYRLGARWRLGEKLAWKRAATEADYVDTVLWATRALYEVEPGIELSGEYRLVKQGGEAKSGPVLEADVALPYLTGLTLGVGYNFAGFSDSLLSESPENGWFLRLRGLF